MIVAPMIVIVAMVAIAVRAAVVVIRVIAAAVIRSMVICTPLMPAVDASDAPWC
jgi:hypothetical protein